MSKKEQIATFIGHRDAYISNGKRNKVKALIKRMIENDVRTFWCGAQGAFDGLCANILKELKEFYPGIKVYVVTPYFNENYLKELNLLIEDGYYDGIISPPIEHVPPKYAIIARNKYMIENSNILIAYVDSIIGNAYACYRYAVRRGDVVTYNLGDLKTL